MAPTQPGTVAALDAVVHFDAEARHPWHAHIASFLFPRRLDFTPRFLIPLPLPLFCFWFELIVARADARFIRQDVGHCDSLAVREQVSAILWAAYTSALECLGSRLWFTGHKRRALAAN